MWDYYINVQRSTVTSTAVRCHQLLIATRLIWPHTMLFAVQDRWMQSECPRTICAQTRQGVGELRVSRHSMFVHQDVSIGYEPSVR